MSFSPRFYDILFKGGFLFVGGLAGSMYATHHHHNNLKILKQDLNILHPPLVEFGAAEDKVEVSKDPHVKQVLKYGNPGPIADSLVRKAYVAAYDRRLRHPAWTAEHLTTASLARAPETDPSGPVDRGKSKFVEDEDLPIPFRARLQDYFKSGYDRGHMFDAMDETFLLSNIAPQVGDGFNRHYWAYLEDWCRRLTGKFADVYVFTVPLYLPRLGTDGKWRVVCIYGVFTPTSPSAPDVLELSAGAFVLPNAAIPDTTPMESFMMPIEAVEHAAGILLFSKAVKAAAKPICTTTKCELIIRKFDDAQKKPHLRKAISAPN
ncbi:hypothetical protein B0H11DRAFT_2086917 [Mycena galericulata]|nr:hypothetical protein B0H11DRAFT_2086917 [Mycena galericulata]